LGDDAGHEASDAPRRDVPPAAVPPKQERRKMDGERTLLKGILSPDADFEVMVTGPVGVKEIERLIRKLEFDKEILAEKSTTVTSGDED
jgi:hypothetical protein